MLIYYPLIFSLISNFPLEQGIIPAVQYYKSCQELLGENFNRVFNELLVLLPDTRKQQELLTAHGDFKALEKQQQGSKPKKSKKKAWQTGTTSNSLELDCQVCPTCKQVLALKDFNTHKNPAHRRWWLPLFTGHKQDYQLAASRRSSTALCDTGPGAAPG